MFPAMLGRKESLQMATPPFPAPAGWTWIFCTEFRHWRSKKMIRAVDYGRKAFCFLVRKKR